MRTLLNSTFSILRRTSTLLERMTEIAIDIWNRRLYAERQ